MHWLILVWLFSIDFYTLVHLILVFFLVSDRWFRSTTYLISYEKLNAFIFHKEATDVDLTQLLFGIQWTGLLVVVLFLLPLDSLVFLDWNFHFIGLIFLFFGWRLVDWFLGFALVGEVIVTEDNVWLFVAFEVIFCRELLVAGFDKLLTFLDLILLLRRVFTDWNYSLLSVLSHLYLFASFLLLLLFPPRLFPLQHNKLVSRNPFANEIKMQSHKINQQNSKNHRHNRKYPQRDHWPNILTPLILSPQHYHPHHIHNHINQRHQNHDHELFIIFGPDTVVDPHTMMIKILNASDLINNYLHS